jgi:hypothetical protein
MLHTRSSCRARSDDLYEHRTHLHVDLKDVRASSDELADALEERPADVLPLVRRCRCQPLPGEAPSQALPACPHPSSCHP